MLRSLACSAAARLLLSTLLPGFAEAGLYVGKTTTSLIPFTEGSTYDWTEYPHVRIRFSADAAGTDHLTSRRTFVVDTGSCGILTKESNLDLTASEVAAGTVGYQYFSSSDFLYVGKWVWRYVWFNKGETGEIRARVQVLAVKTRYLCPDYNMETDGSVCHSPTETVDEADLITTVLGIGYGRMHDGQRDSTPEKNPLLNIQAMAVGGSTWNDTFWYGYIIDKAGITVGLTETNWGAMTSRQIYLPPDPHLPVSRRLGIPKRHFPWSEMPARVSIAGSAFSDGTAILDTGLSRDHASIRMPRSVITTLTRNPGQDHSLIDGYRVEIRLGRVDRTPVVTEEWTTGLPPVGGPDPSCGIQPPFTGAYNDPSARVPVRDPFVNTGRHIYRKWRVGFDAAEGIVGFAAVDPPPC